MVLDRLNPHNTPVLTAVFAGLTLLLGFFVPTHWQTWIHWSWLGIIGHFAAIGFAVFFVWVLSFEAAESMMKDKSRNKIDRSRAASYGVCIMAVLCGAVLLGLMASAGVEPGDENEATGQVATTYVPPWSLGKRDRLIEDTFIVALLPALLGVRCALGPKEKKT